MFGITSVTDAIRAAFLAFLPKPQTSAQVVTELDGLVSTLTNISAAKCQHEDELTDQIERARELRSAVIQERYFVDDLRRTLFDTVDAANRGYL